MLQLCHGRDGGGVRSVRVEHDGDAHRAEEGLAHGGEEPLAGGHVGAADEDRRVAKVFRTSGKDRAVHEIPDGIFRDAPIAHHLVGASVVGDNAVEDAGVGRAVQLQKQFAHGGNRGGRR